MRVTALARYPVKSLGGVGVDALDIESWGPAGDRRWAITDPQGRLVTARTAPTLLTIGAAPTDDGVRLTSADGDRLDVVTPTDGPSIPVNVTRLPTAHDAAAAFLTAACGRDLRLVWQPDPRLRSVNPRNGGLEGEVLSLADAGPILLTTVRSLERLQEWIGPEPRIGMERFRPNVVVDGDRPFVEDDWPAVRIGDIEFRVQQRCDRCLMTTIDPVTTERGDEPLHTLERHRSDGDLTYFGIRLVPRSSGTIAVGDTVVPA